MISTSRILASLTPLLLALTISSHAAASDTENTSYDAPWLKCSQQSKQNQSVDMGMQTLQVAEAETQVPGCCCKLRDGRVTLVSLFNCNFLGGECMALAKCTAK